MSHRVFETSLLSVAAVTCGLALCPLPGSAAAPTPAAPARPTYQFLRWQEDWSVLPKLDPATRDAFDGIKNVSLGGSAWASFGGDLSARVENWDNFNFGAPPNVSHDDTFLLTRVRAHADLHLGPQTRLFGELKGAYISNRNLPGGVRAIDEDKFELQQLFADFKFDLGSDASIVLRPGRQALVFGAQRLVSPLPWANALRTWDGVEAIVTAHGWTVTGFGAAFVPVRRNGIGHADRDELLYGVYARRAAAGGKEGLEVYALRNEWDQARTFNGTTGADRRWTLGSRLWGPVADRLDYEVELSYQTGHTGAGSVSAWSFASLLGYELGEDRTLRLWGGFDWASGDGSAGGDVKTFNQLYPLGHAYFGAIDMIGRQNIVDISAGATWKALPKLVVNFGAHSFAADSSADAIYNAGGGVVRAGGTYQSSHIGYETDLTVRWNAGRHLVLEAGGGRFFAGDAIDEAGPDEDIDFLYASTTFTF